MRIHTEEQSMQLFLPLPIVSKEKEFAGREQQMIRNNKIPESNLSLTANNLEE